MHWVDGSENVHRTSVGALNAREQLEDIGTDGNVMSK
jgi:hypothetical protein